MQWLHMCDFLLKYIDQSKPTILYYIKRRRVFRRSKLSVFGASQVYEYIMLSNRPNFKFINCLICSFVYWRESSFTLLNVKPLQIVCEKCQFSAGTTSFTSFYLLWLPRLFYLPCCMCMCIMLIWRFGCDYCGRLYLN